MPKDTDKFVTHSFEPVWDSNSKILILGTMPSPKSRELGFYYSHPQNRFWRVMAEVFKRGLPVTIDEKREFLLSNRIALWDVLESCKIKNAADSSISQPKINNFSRIFDVAQIRAVFTTGKKATLLYEKLYIDGKDRNDTLYPKYLPSTSPANCAVSFEGLVRAYSDILKYL